jgi:hypothetical protein
MKGLKALLVLVACSAFSFLSACGGGSSKTLPPNTIAPSSSNVAAITVNAGPDNDYANGAFANVTICVPGTTTCQTIGGVLVDTGSYGLRLLSSVVTIALPQEKAADGDAIVECVPFLDSYTWGPVQMADIEIASEKASSVPIQVLSDTDFTVPQTTCTSSASPADTLATLGANGILGVGLFAQDCGTTCPASAELYYDCPSATAPCTAISVTGAQQVQNPVSLFANDNNGVIVELPAVSGGAAATLSGSLVFGIGTETNNLLNGATVYEANDEGNFTTTFSGTTMSESFIDSGSNAYFFYDTSLPTCFSENFYCPNSTQNLSATNTGANNASGTVDFSIADANTLFSNMADSVFEDLGGPGPSGSFDWGLPFFYGRNVYVAIQGTTAPNGTTPYWAY